MVAELKWVHDMIRRDLRTVRQMAADTAAGRAAGEIRAGIRSLAADGPLWQLKAGCLHYLPAAGAGGPPALATATPSSVKAATETAPTAGITTDTAACTRANTQASGLTGPAA
jgi:hypothetical protein